MRVAITGIGIVGPNGIGTDALWDALLHGRSGITAIEDPAVRDAVPAHAWGIVPDWDASPWLEKRVARRMGRFSQFAVACARMALEDAGIAELDPERTGVVVHTGAGGNVEGDREVVHRAADPSRTGPLYVPLLSANMGAANVAIQLGITGPTTAGVGACAAGAIAMVEGLHLVQRGEVDVVLAGAAEAALSPFLISCLANAGALTTDEGDPSRLSRPFDRDRTGFVPAEGGAMCVLEPLERAKARGARIICELVGGALGCDAYHITAPEPTGAGAERVLRRAIASARGADVAAIVAHGTGTKLNDEAESAAIARVLGDRLPDVPVTGPKSVFGHTLGAAGAFGAVTGALIVANGAVPPTANYETPDPGCADLAIVAGREQPLGDGCVLVNAFGFGGQNAVLVLGPA